MHRIAFPPPAKNYWAQKSVVPGLRNCILVNCVFSYLFPFSVIFRSQRTFIHIDRELNLLLHILKQEKPRILGIKIQTSSYLGRTNCQNKVLRGITKKDNKSKGRSTYPDTGTEQDFPSIPGAEVEAFLLQALMSLFFVTNVSNFVKTSTQTKQLIN